KSRQSLQQSGASESLALSQIDSLKGNTTLVAGESLDINAGRLNAGGDLILQGREVGLNAAHITDSSHTAQQSQQSGLSVGITYGPVKAAKSAYDKSMAGSQNSGSAVGKWFAHDIAILKASQAAMSPTVITGGRSRSSADERSSHTQAVVSEAAAGGKLLIQATGGSIRSEGAQMSAEGDALLHARDHINLGFARSSQSRRSGFSIDTRDHSTPGGTFNDSGSGQAAIDQAAGSSLSVGGAATLQTQSGDINILGSSLVSQHDLALNSAGKVNILSTQSSQSMSERQISSGIGSAQISDTEYFSGWMKNTQNQRSSQVEQLKSQIGSLGGNVHIQAAGAYAQQAADVSAARDIDIRAQSIDIAAGRNLGSSHQSERDVKIGSFAKVSSPLIDLVNAVEGAAKSKAEGRTRALQGMAAAAQGYQAYDALSGGGAIAKAEAGVGFKTANHSQNQSHAQSLGNSLAAGGHLNLQATAGDIRLQHTDAKAGGKLALDAAQNIVLESGQSQQHLDGKNSSTGLSVGVGASVGAQTGLYVYAEAGASKGKNRFDAQNHSHTPLAADSIQLRSGGDTTLKGATATANRIDADIKGRLNIESVQDQIAQESKQSGGGVRVQISLGTAWEASGNFNQSKSSGGSQSVNQQSGLFAGEGGYHINAQSVHLKGGAIASTAPAEQNALTTHDFSYENISNHSSGSAGSMGIGINQNMLSGSKYAVARGIIEDQIADSSESQSDHSTTYSVLSEGVFKISSESGQKAAESIRKDLEGAHRKLDAVDVRQMLTNVEAKRDAKGQLTDLALTLSDEAYDKMFAASADLYVLEKDKDGKTITNGTDKYGKELPKYRKLTDEEKQNLQAGKGGKITVFNNGIFTDINSAAQYADQHNSDAQYFIYFPQTSNAFSEMLVAGYMKFMENDFMGLTNATQETRAIMAKYGQDGVHFDGHSRGAMTTGNALESLAKDKTQLGQLPSLTVNFIGPAYNASKADNLLSSLQGRENMSPEQAAAAELKYQSHQADTVGGLIGWNKPTGGNLSEGKAIWQEWKDMLGKPATVHSCYGKGNTPCSDKKYWKESPSGIPEWRPASSNSKKD
nr:hemagglutinin repeat-containing protein [Neisseria sp.]